MEDSLDIVIIDDHNIIIEGLEILLAFEKSIKILKTYNDANLFLKDLRENTVVPKIILMDLIMPTISGFEAAKILKKEFPQIKIIILSMNYEAKMIYELISTVGVEGYLSKKINRVELVSALKKVSKGYQYISEEAEVAMSGYREKIISYPEIKLSSREKEIVRLMIDGLSNKEISTKLFISGRTVETHRKNIYRKTETHNLPKLMRMVADLNLLA